MAFPVRIHFDNSAGFRQPFLWAWYDASTIQENLPPAGRDVFGPFWEFPARRTHFMFKFKEGPGQAGPWEAAQLERERWATIQPGGAPDEVWCIGMKAFVYAVQPRVPAAQTAAQRVNGLGFVNGLRIPDTGGVSGLGANLLADDRGVLFGLYHPNAARVYVFGTFNDWQRPGAPNEDPARFCELSLHRGWFGVPNTWLGIVPSARTGHEYKFFIEGGVPTDSGGRPRRSQTDPYARDLGSDFNANNSVVVDPAFTWTDQRWRTPDIGDAIIYELSVHGLTEGDPTIAQANQGRFDGVTERIRAGYFDDLGINVLALMPLAEFPSPEGPETLGYDPSLYFAVERDFGSPADLRTLIDVAHSRGLAVVLDQVFNHTSSDFNPLWQAILEHPAEERNPAEGGLYFSGRTDWGNRVATEKIDVQNMLIDACKMLITEYHVDGFRFDVTRSDVIDHGFLRRLADEIRGGSGPGVKPDALLIAENLPNESDLDRSGFDGFAQWCDHFQHKIKALLREGPFNGMADTPDGMGDIFFFSKSAFAAHTNNVVNYNESHDENSVPFEVATNPLLNNSDAKDRKARLGFFATLMALGQPMIYMGEEFGIDRPRNFVTVNWPPNLPQNPFFRWARGVIRLRRRYPGLRLRGYDPVADGRFAWIAGPWMDGAHGGGRRVIGWRSRPSNDPFDTLVVLLNFEGGAQIIDVEFGMSGVWVKLADIETVSDIPAEGTNAAADGTAVHTNDGRFAGFSLPSSSGFIYKWQGP